MLYPGASMPIKMSQLFGGILGGVAFGLIAGLLLGSCVFEGGPNRSAAGGGMGAGQGSAEATRGVGGPDGNVEEAPGSETGETGNTPGGMDPGASPMGSIMARIGALKQALETNPNDRASLVELGNMYYDANKFEQATGYYERAVSLDRNDPNLLTDLANCYIFLGRSPEALGLLRQTQEQFPKHWQSAATLFFVAANQNEPALAKTALERVKTLNPSFAKLPDMERIYAGMTAPKG